MKTTGRALYLRCHVGDPDQWSALPAEGKGKWEALASSLFDGVPPALRTRLKAFARDCVTHGDMTPMAERMLLRILDEHKESSA